MTVNNLSTAIQARTRNSYTERYFPSAETLKAVIESRVIRFELIRFHDVVFHFTILPPLPKQQKQPVNYACIRYKVFTFNLLISYIMFRRFLFSFYRRFERAQKETSTNSLK